MFTLGGRGTTVSVLICEEAFGALFSASEWDKTQPAMLCTASFLLPSTLSSVIFLEKARRNAGTAGEFWRAFLMVWVPMQLCCDKSRRSRRSRSEATS